MGFLADILGGTADEFYSSLPPEIRNLYGTYGADGTYTSGIPQVTAPQNISFQPYTVTSGNLGNITTDEFGGTQFNLGESQQAMQDLLLGGSSDFYRNAMQDTAGRETDIYNRMRAAQRPEEQQAMLDMEERLFAQGRGGVATNQYGGTPEQLSLNMARERAKNEAMLGAMGQAQQEQMQQATLGGMFQQEGYAPLAQLMNASSAGAGAASMADVARRQQGEYDLQAQLANLQADMGSRTGLANLYSGLFSSATGALGSVGDTLLDFILG
tara:strand:- start:1063 stop:1872 length:810 start_codon:yes stop_codon:yes gene_type:complete